jgi:hypothetical protein
MAERASVFGNEDDFDIADFTPKQAVKETPQASAEEVRAVAESSSFRSRDPSPTPAPATVAEKLIQKREARRYRTGRDTQLNLKISEETRRSFYAIAYKQGWVLGETLERAVTALERELKAQK